MAAYNLLFGKSDTLAATLLSGTTSTTLTTGNFGSPSGSQIYVVDYDVPLKAEIILATVVTTAVTSITRGLTGGAAGTTDHQIGAKIGSIFVPQHYDALSQGTGLATGTSSIGIPAAAMRQEAWGTWVPTYGGTGSMTYLSTSTTVARYIRVGNFVYFQIVATGTTGGTPDVGLTFTVPVTRSRTDTNLIVGSGEVVDSTDKGAYCLWSGASTTTVFVRKYDAANYGSGSGRELRISGFYEI